jgi:hypothetical protein
MWRSRLAVGSAAAVCSKEAIETARLTRESGYIFKSER